MIEENSWTNKTSNLIDILSIKERVVVFLPNTNELQRFIHSGAFEELQRRFDLHYVLPKADSERMLSDNNIFVNNSYTVIDIPAARFSVWKTLFEASCVYYSPKSSSFAIRVNPVLRSRSINLLKLLPVSARPAMHSFLSWLRDHGLVAKGWRKRCDYLIGVFDCQSRESKILQLTKKDPYNTFVQEKLAELGPSPEVMSVLSRANPHFCVIPSSLLDVFCNDVVWACEAGQIGCLVLQSGWDNMSSKGILLHKSPFVGTWGPQSIRHGESIQGIPKASMGSLGAPHYEFLVPASADTKREFRRKLGVSEHQTLLLFGGSFRQFDETEALEQLDRATEAGVLGDVKIVYRPHPWRATRSNETHFFDRTWKHVLFDPDMKERYVREHQEPGYIKRNVPMFDMSYLSKLVSSVDAVISPMSTLLLESMILQRPTMAIAFGDGKHAHDPSVTSQMTHFREVAKSSALIWCNDSSRLIEDCRRLVLEGLTVKMAAAQENLLADVVCREPGIYASRLADFVEEKVLPYSRKLRGQRAARLRGSISHAYGANLIAHRYCGLDSAGPAVPGYWMHGWIPAYHNRHPALIALHKKNGQFAGYNFLEQISDEKENVTQWVSRRDQAEYLIESGYKHVRSIGLPIVYLPKPKIERLPDSLLVLPPHSHKTHGPGDPLAEEYARQIALLRPRFKHIWVGLNEDDLAKDQWCSAFRKQDINVFCTTDQGDPNTLGRLSAILYGFEYVTTNGYGSHIALAAYCGAKVSIYGPFADFPLQRMKSTHAVKMFPDLLETARYLCTEQALREHYPFLFVEPDQAQVLTEWAAREVGEDCRLTPQELSEAFGWRV